MVEITSENCIPNSKNNTNRYSCFKHGTTFCFEGRKIGERNKHFGINKYILNISSEYLFVLFLELGIQFSLVISTMQLN
jgi:hypothetical protein